MAKEKQLEFGFMKPRINWPATIGYYATLAGYLGAFAYGANEIINGESNTIKEIGAATMPVWVAGVVAGVFVLQGCFNKLNKIENLRLPNKNLANLI